MTGTKLLILILRRGASKFRFDKSSNFLFIHLLVSVTSCLRGRPKWLQYYMGGSLGNPKSDYVIHEQPLILACVRVKSIISFSRKKYSPLHCFNAVKTPHGMWTLFKWYRNALHAIHPIMQSMIESWNTSQILSASYPKSVLEAYFVKFVCTKPNRIRLRFSRRVWPCRPLLSIHPPTHIYGLDARRKGWFTPAHKIDLGK